MAEYWIVCSKEHASYGYSFLAGPWSRLRPARNRLREMKNQGDNLILAGHPVRFIVKTVHRG